MTRLAGQVPSSASSRVLCCPPTSFQGRLGATRAPRSSELLSFYSTVRHPAPPQRPGLVLSQCCARPSLVRSLGSVTSVCVTTSASLPVAPRIRRPWQLPSTIFLDNWQGVPGVVGVPLLPLGGTGALPTLLLLPSATFFPPRQQGRTATGQGPWFAWKVAASRPGFLGLPACPRSRCSARRPVSSAC